MGIAVILERLRSDRAGLREHEALGREEREAMARDARVSGEVLDRIVARGSRAGQQLPELLRALDLDPERVKRSHGEVMRDMQIACSLCASSKRCSRDLGRGVSRLTFRHYCPNAETISALQGGAR